MKLTRKVWTEQDDEDLRYWHACRYTDGRIARKLGCSRRTILRQREAMGLRAVSRPVETSALVARSARMESAGGARKNALITITVRITEMSKEDFSFAAIAFVNIVGKAAHDMITHTVNIIAKPRVAKSCSRLVI